MPLTISVVIPYYNGSRFIGDALASVRAQTLAPLETIVVDDGSRPEEAEFVRRAARDCEVVHLSTNRGQAAARNVGIARARGNWIAFLDCDDLWDPRKLAMQAAVVEANAGCRALHCSMKTIRPDGTEELTQKGEVELHDFLLFPCPIFPSALLIERAALIDCGLFDATLHCCEDLDLCLRFSIRHGKFFAVPEPLVVRRVQPDGVSRNIANFWSDAERIYRNYLPLFGDERRARETLREVHTDMGLRAVYARDFGLIWAMLRRASRRDASMTAALSRIAWRVIRHRLERGHRVSTE